MRLLVTGATGFVGRRLCARAKEEGHAPRILTRDPAAAREVLPDVDALAWDPLSGPPPAAALEGVDVVVNLMGESIGQGRWTKKKKQRIRESRIAGTRNLVEGILSRNGRPRALVNASAIGAYQPRGEETIAENGEPADDFLGQVCRDWEAEARRAETGGVRVAIVRSGVVLGPDGGALPEMMRPFKMFVGGPVAGGSQWMSWIHRDDLCALHLFVAGRNDLSGSINGTAPEPVTNREFARTLGRVLGRPSFFPTPYFVLRVALGEFATALVASHRVLPARAQSLGFTFRYPNLEAALTNILTPTS